ncbi:MAG: peptidase M20 [Spirochaetaceae bacterium]|nr:peptidase M20 [Spirochaetaceae bacterium]|tara:strand:- start:68215 stop:69393 length:1179 start_codon:yes stop_codon:yes gene_type:complete
MAQLVQEAAARARRFRQDIHAHPELAFQEHRTSQIVASRLEELGYEVHSGLARTGVVGVLRGKEGGPGIGLRADMDALPILEQPTPGKDKPYISRNEGTMHACGHDGHTSMLLGAAEVLANRKTREPFAGDVVLIFQPAEENEGGGKEMVEQGLFTKFPVSQIFALHNWPGMPAGSIGLCEGPIMAAYDRFDLTVEGEGCHAAMPQFGDDVILIASEIVQSLQKLTSRNHPFEPSVLSITKFHAGDAYNVLPARANLAGTLRTFDPGNRDRLIGEIERTALGLASANGVRAKLEWKEGYPATINERNATELARKTAMQVVGAESVVDPVQPSTGSEDFGYMLQSVDGCYAWIGNGPGEGGCLLHNPAYDFNDEILETGIRYWVQLVENFFQS